MLLSTEGIILGWNRQAEALYGYAAEEAIGRPVGFLHIDAAAGMQEAAQEIRNAQALGRHDAEGWNRQARGSVFWAASTFVMLPESCLGVRACARMVVDLTPYKALAARLPLVVTGSWRWNPATGMVAVSPQCMRMLGRAGNAPVQARAWVQRVHAEDRRLLRQLMRQKPRPVAAPAETASQRPPMQAELRMRTGDGQYRWFRLQAEWRREGATGLQLLGTGVDVHDARPAREDSERLARVLQSCARGVEGNAGNDAALRLLAEIFRDTHRLRTGETARQMEQDRIRASLAVLTDSVLVADGAGCIDYLNPAAERMTGWTLAEARGLPAQSLLSIRFPQAAHETDLITDCLAAGPGEARFRHGLLRSRAGKEHAVDVTASPIHGADGHLVGVAIGLHDVTAIHALLNTIAHQASHDPLTGLLNRREFEARLQAALEQARAGCESAALIYLDLDQFKIVNDTCGHAAGDALLQQLARAYRAAAREVDTFARLGGDEFALVIARCTTDEAGRVAARLLDATTTFRFDCGGRTFRVGASIGVVPITARAASVEQLMRLSDHACYLAKEHGRNRIHVHREKDAAMSRRMNDMHWVGRLNEALRGDSLALYYQPIAPLSQDGGKLHYEILLRLKERDGGCVGPGAFLPAAERFDLMPAIDRWVLKKVLEWLEGEPEHVERLDMATINLSRRTLADESFQQYAIACLEKSPVPAHKLCFEITENGAIADPVRTIRFIETLKDRGCRFSLDDFGTGMTSFSYLKLLPVDFIKIDGSFVTMMKDSAVDREMVRFTNEISHIMGRRTIAEYVADAAIYERLRALQIDYAQGNWIGAPRPLDANMAQ
ncbi:MAG TPA: EAL domain-containing protein [Noviherbaspirillum sp.]|jgi:diguanylate cyclase (GGDEF)-like protein/PAS domain S-box-containing protein|uniref:EAL domain-containing protein n=1 Tax=Noviherbaspirillum sp. TaxID=1926288 RepID=UPI002F947E92